MGLFNMRYDRPGPGVAKDAPRKTGISRWFEIVGRDLWDFTKANLLTVLCFAPTLIVAILAGVWLLLDPNLLILILGLVLGSSFGVLAGPGLCAMLSLMLKSLRDEPKFFWHTYKKAFRDNFRQGAVAGVVLCFVFLLQIFGFILYFRHTTSSFVLALLFLDVLLISMMVLFYFPQLVLLDLPTKAIFTNSLRLSLGLLPRSLPAAIIQIGLLGAQILFLPLTVPIFVIIGLWIPVFTGLFIIYKPLNDIFHIEEQFNIRREAEIKAYSESSQDTTSSDE